MSSRLPSVEEFVHEWHYAPPLERTLEDFKAGLRARDLAVAKIVREACVQALAGNKDSEPYKANDLSTLLFTIDEAALRIRAIDLEQLLEEK